jgi:hypothetical protein
VEHAPGLDAVGEVVEVREVDFLERQRLGEGGAQFGLLGRASRVYRW